VVVVARARAARGVHCRARTLNGGREQLHGAASATSARTGLPALAAVAAAATVATIATLTAITGGVGRWERYESATARDASTAQHAWGPGGPGRSRATHGEKARRRDFDPSQRDDLERATTRASSTSSTSYPAGAAESPVSTGPTEATGSAAIEQAVTLHGIVVPTLTAPSAALTRRAASSPAAPGTATALTTGSATGQREAGDRIRRSAAGAAVEAVQAGAAGISVAPLFPDVAADRRC
jgi:hypothetical protein